MLVTMGMNGAPAGPSSHFDISGIFDYPTWIYRPLNGLNCADVSLNNIHPSIHPTWIYAKFNVIC